MSFKVKALYEYSSPHEDDLPFPIGQVITVTDEEDADWYTGEYVDDAGVKHEGIFPRNFVEKYEPVAPPRPTRTKTKKEPEPAAEEPAAAEEPLSPPAQAPRVEVDEPKPISPPPSAVVEPIAAVSPPAPKTSEPVLPSSPPRASAEPIANPQSPPREAPAKRAPPVSEKPASSSFKDRIAAFNKAAAPPIAPFKPSGLGGGSSSSFIKKPFVAPPPKGNTYVPTQRNAPVAPVYRRDEDPEIKEREAENVENAQKAGLIPSGSKEGDEDEPKPMSLKERMALLQRQQQEQAQRHAEAAAKKEKPKRPATKPRMPSQDPTSEGGEGEAAALSPAPTLERRDTGDTAGRQSVDETRPPRIPAQPRRKPSVDPEPRDGNEADMSGAGETTEGPEELTEREDSDEKPRRPSHVSTGHPAAEKEEGEEDENEEEEEEEEDEEAKEFRRKEELRARMARLGGGMGMPGMFGMPMPGAAPSLPPKKKKGSSSEKPPTSEDSQSLASPRAPPVPLMMALPGMGGPKKAQDEPAAEEEAPEVENVTPRSPPAVPGTAAASAAAPPVPSGRPAPPPVPAESRPPPAAPVASAPLSEGSESDDELSGANDPAETPRAEEPPSAPSARAPPPLPPMTAPPPPLPSSPRSPISVRSNDDNTMPLSPSSRRASRLPPPIPGAAQAPPPSQTRAPPPPPPGGLPRTSTSNDHDGEDEEEEYEGDYDTDIASSVHHKDALKAHGRDSSMEDTLSVASPKDAPPSLPPPIPSNIAPRAPPPLPSQPPPDNRPATRGSIDVPRAAPPPPPQAAVDTAEDDDYDPYNYNPAPPAKTSAVPPYLQPPPPPRRQSEDVYSESSSSYTPAAAVAAPGGRAPGAPRGSLDIRSNRRSMDLLNRPSMESGFVANDIDLAAQSKWWLQPKGLPPQLQGRKDIFHESEESQSTQHGAKTTVTRDIYILFQDYSQTVITVRFDPQDANDVHLEQRHEGPPRSLRQDQLEESYERFGRPISEAVNAKKDTVVADGTPQGLVLELLKPFKDALLPVGTRAFGALVYSNLANASTTQTDQIRPGDIITIRNAKFQGKHGPMHAKYSVEVGKPDHVGVVAEWDGTKKKVRAWEQGRESKKVKMESFKLDDLRSGEVKIWRVMPRSWVGWEGQN